MEPIVGDKLAHDTSCVKVTIIIRFVRQMTKTHYVVLDSDGEVHLCVEANDNTDSQFYVDHLSEVASGFGFLHDLRGWSKMGDEDES